MKAPLQHILDGRRAADIAHQILSHRLGYLPEWQLDDESGGDGITWITARLLEAVLLRLNQAPEKNKLAFLDTLGICLIPAQQARVPIVFQLADDAAPTRAAVGTQLVAPPPPGSTEQIVFETEENAGLSPAKIEEVVSLWPGRDQYIDHSPETAAGSSFRPFRMRDLTDIPHHLYMAHPSLLALNGQARLNIGVELFQQSSEHLSTIWEYWDGNIWRAFKDMQPTCGEEARRLDSTAGFTRSGRFLLESDCAEAQTTEVDGVESYWIRARLDEPLPPEPALTLASIDGVNISSEIMRPLAVDVASIDCAPIDLSSTPPANVRVVVRTVEGLPLENVRVEVINTTTAQIQSGETNIDGVAGFGIGFPSGNREVLVANIQLDTYVFESELFELTIFEGREVTFALNISGLALDQALVDESEADVSKPFYPFGQQPQPGSVFYFANEEIFSKPGATVRLFLTRTVTPQDSFGVETTNPNPPNGGNTSEPPKPLSHIVAWEYWNGRQWIILETYANDPDAADQVNPLDFSTTGFVDVTVPDDLELTAINDQEGLWMRVRLVSGGFGFRQQVTWGDQGENTFSYVITQPPALSSFLLGYSWQDGPYPPERLITYNDFQYEDRTEEAKWPGQPFEPFAFVQDQTPALYLGFSDVPPVEKLNLLWEIEEDPGEIFGPPLHWEYWDGFNWRRVTVSDGTANLRVPGMLSYIGPSDGQLLARFSTPRYWLRGRLQTDRPPGSPTIKQIHTNAVWASQRQTLTNEPIGSSNGRPDQIFRLRQVPILPQEQIEVRELAGQRANVEWRILAMEVLGDDYAIIQEIEEKLRQESDQTEIRFGPILLVRNRQKKVAEAWVQWQGRRHLYDSEATDRHYVIDQTQGRLAFGDGANGAIPPIGSDIRAAFIQSGGGSRGNVAAGIITQMLSSIGSVEAVSNPLPAEGGADAETVESVSVRGPQTLRHRGRAISAMDYETMAKEASASVAVARTLPGRDAAGRNRAGWVTVVIIPHSQDARPYPSFGLRRHVQRYLDVRAPSNIAHEGKIVVVGPQYQPIDIAVHAAPVDQDDAGLVEQGIRDALTALFHPLTGGQQGQGWLPGRDVYYSDVAATIERIAGLDFVHELSLSANGTLYHDVVPIRVNRIAVIGEVQVQIF